MRIIYGRDYYDNALAYGSDTDIAFVRERSNYCDDKFMQGGDISPPGLDLRLHPLKEGSRPRYGFTNRAFQVYEAKKLITLFLYPCKVVVCGKYYNGIMVVSDMKYEVIWSKQDLYAWFERYKLRPEIWSFTSFKNKDQYAEAALDRYFTPNEVGKDSLAWLIQNKITVLTYNPQVNGDSKWRINGDDLKDFHFYKVVDPFTLFQEISMWVGGILPGSANPMVQITDDTIKVAKHGFDPKWSFRKQGKSSDI